MCVNCRALETEMEAQQEVEQATVEVVKVHPDTEVNKLVL